MTTPEDPGIGGDPGAAGASDDYEVRIGLEVHVQLRTTTKMFCGCRVQFGAPPNTRVCPVCLGLPGALPVPNRRAVRLGVRAALALGCTLHRRSAFDRKHYFYPDLPKGYQITQHARPLAAGGRVGLPEGSAVAEVGIRRLHLEEDAGKSVHDRFPDVTAVDLNRAGVPLIEIVTEPELRSPAAARAFLLRLKQLLEHYAGVSDCNMEEGSLRVDANLSVLRAGATRPGTRTEVKNLNSFSFVERALAYERDRQAEILDRGGEVAAETRLYDAGRGETRRLRGKEEAFDYRYFPEPDLPPLEVPESISQKEAAALGPLPHEYEGRLTRRYGLPERVAIRLAATPARAEYFERVAGGRDAAFARATANFILGELAAEANRRAGETPVERLLAPDRLRRIVELRLEGTLSSDTAARALGLLLADEAQDVDELVEARGLAQVREPGRIARWVEEVVTSHPAEAKRYAAGEARLLRFFMGRVMRASEGRADPERTRALLRKRLETRDAD